MKKVKINVLAILATGMILTSCGLFRGGGHERCPAYGSNVEEESNEVLFASGSNEFSSKEVATPTEE